MAEIFLKNQEGRIVNLEEKTYYFCFREPMYQKGIVERFYGTDSDKIHSAYAQFSGKSGILNKLIERDWIKPVNKPVFTKEMKIDKRSLNRKYFIATPKPIIERLNKKIQLDKFEEYIIREKFESPFFRSLSRSFLGGSIPADPIEYIIAIMDMIFIEIDENCGLRELNIELSNNITNINQYNKVKKELRKKDIIQKVTTKIIEHPIIIPKKNESCENSIHFVGRKKRKKQHKIDLTDILKNMYSSRGIEDLISFLIIPNILFCRMRMITELGRTHFLMNRSFIELNKIGDSQ